MNPLSALGGILSGLLGGVVAAVQGWQNRLTLKAEAEAKVLVAEAEAKVRILEKQSTAEIEWDLQAVSQMKGSWKDEWFTLLLSIPAILAFIRPDLTLIGFQALESMPLWYQSALGVAIAASFGYRKLVDIFSTMRGKK